MYEAGRNLRKRREQLRLKYRDIEEASYKIANDHKNQEFVVRLSRLADIENKGTVPSIYRLFSLSAIYGVDFATVLRWYGVDLNDLAATSIKLEMEQTRPFHLDLSELKYVNVPLDIMQAADLKKTSYLSRHVQSWGAVPLTLLGSLDFNKHRYAFIGTEDWSMDPLIRPGSFVQIDESKRQINNIWVHEHDRAIYFVEHRQGFRCGWCTERGEFLLVESHAASHLGPEIYKHPDEAEIVGQVVGIAMRLDQAKKRHKRF